MASGRPIAAAGLFALALTGTGAAGQSQDPSAIGNPQLRNFELPGTSTTPEQPATAQPPVVDAPPPPIAAPPPPPAPRSTTTAPRPEAGTTVPAAPPRAAPVSRPAARPVAPGLRPLQGAPTQVAPAPSAPVVPAPADLQQVMPAPLAPTPAPAPQARPLPQAPVAEQAGAGFHWLYLAIAGLLGLLGFVAYRQFKRRAAPIVETVVEPEVAEQAAATPPPPAPRPEPAPKPQPALRAEPAPEAAAATAPGAGVVAIQLRPWLELEFRPDRAAATLTDASVEFELIIRNGGNAPARNIRIESAIFNAGPEQEQEIAAWYAEPIRERTPPGIAVLPPREQVQIRSAVAIPKEHVREIIVQGRRLFIPTVAFNVAYDWGANKTGQTSVSYVVGREAETPSEKMGAFRLDLGPRLYRSVGQRQTKLARIV